MKQSPGLNQEIQHTEQNLLTLDLQNTLSDTSHPLEWTFSPMIADYDCNLPGELLCVYMVNIYATNPHEDKTDENIMITLHGVYVFYTAILDETIVQD